MLASCIFPLSSPSTSPKKSLTFPGHFALYCFEMPQRMKIFVKCTFFCHRPLPPPCRRLACAATVGATTDTHRPATSQLTSNSSFSSLFSFTEASYTLWTSLTLAAPPLRSVSSATAARLLLLLVDGARRAAPGALLLCCPPLLCCPLLSFASLLPPPLL